MIDAVWDDLCRVRAQAPLVHNITNLVVMNTTANALLALGASPVMAHAPEEVEEFVALAGALVVNIGTLSSPWIAAMRLAARRARELGRPWLLDPVGAGATRFRDETAAALLALAPAVIRGNGSEIAALAARNGSTKGVDSTLGSEAALDPARALARRTGAVVAVTGAVDLITDGEKLVRLANGHPMMTRVTGLGCSSSAVLGAFLAIQPDRLRAAVSALAVFGIAGEIAAEGAAGPGALQLRLYDALYALDRPTLAARLRQER